MTECVPLSPSLLGIIPAQQGLACPPGTGANAASHRVLPGKRLRGGVNFHTDLPNVRVKCVFRHPPQKQAVHVYSTVLRREDRPGPLRGAGPQSPQSVAGEGTLPAA